MTKQWERDRWQEADEAARQREAGRSSPPGWLDPAAYPEKARAEAMERPDPQMEQVDRIYRTDRAKYDALPTELHVKYGLYCAMKGDA